MAALPLGTKSLVEIERYDDPVDQVTHLTRLLEHLLKTLTPEEDDDDAPPQTFESLIELHKNKFSWSDKVDDIRWLRNQIVHATGRATNGRVLQAVEPLNDAVHDVLKYCPQDLQAAATGRPRPPQEPDGLRRYWPPDNPAAPPPPRPKPLPPPPTFRTLVPEPQAKLDWFGFIFDLIRDVVFGLIIIPPVCGLVALIPSIILAVIIMMVFSLSKDTLAILIGAGCAIGAAVGVYLCLARIPELLKKNTSKA